MAYVVLLSEQSKVELAAIKKSGNKATLKKIANMLVELQEHPRTGTGQVEHLKHFVFEETWSRRINKQYRMIYEIHDLEAYVSVVSEVYSLNKIFSCAFDRVIFGYVMDFCYLCTP